MQNVLIKHNPYKVISVIEVNGEAPKKDSKLVQYLNQRFQLWVDKIPKLLADEYNDDSFDITFFGTELDYQDFLAAAESAKADGITITSTKMDAKEFGEKETDIRQLFTKVQQLPFEELQSPAVADAFNKAFTEEFEVNVVATMSAGKSTLINALIGQKLMPSKNGACTATITKIKDDDDGTFKAVSYGADNAELESFSVLDYKTMQALNNNPAVSEIHVSGNIPFVNSDEVSLVLIDTPGPDNARDKRHGKVTAKALDQSSKMLVMFVMNGGKLHDDAQDAFLRQIAKSMSVGGKQSRERFMFVINKLDAYDEEDDDIAGETIPETIAYLEEMGIENPNIFPAAAEPALLIRRYQNTFDESTRQTIMSKLEPMAKKLIAQQQLHLEKYPTLVKKCQDKIEQELQTAIASGDILGQALIHTGIRGIEETIEMYVTKYCRPQKITNVVNTFKHHLDSAEAFQKTKKEIASREAEQTEFQKQIGKLEAKLTSKAENEAFKKRISSLEISTKLGTELDKLILDVQKELTDFFEKCPAEMEEDDAQGFIKEFSRLADQKQAAFQVSVDNLLHQDVEEKSKTLLAEYIKKLVAISDEFRSEGLSIDLASFVKGKLTALNADDVIDKSIDTRTETHTETRYRDETRRATGWKRVLNPKRWFNPEYTERVSYDVDVTEKITFISRQKMRDSLVSPITADLHKEKARIVDYATEETQNIKEYFYDKFDEVDSILAAKASELKQATASKEASAKALKEATSLLARLEDVKEELEKILEI